MPVSTRGVNTKTELQMAQNRLAQQRYRQRKRAGDAPSTPARTKRGRPRIHGTRPARELSAPISQAVDDCISGESSITLPLDGIAGQEINERDFDFDFDAILAATASSELSTATDNLVSLNPFEHPEVYEGSLLPPAQTSLPDLGYRYTPGAASPNGMENGGPYNLTWATGPLHSAYALPDPLVQALSPSSSDPPPSSGVPSSMMRPECFQLQNGNFGFVIACYFVGFGGF